MYKYDHYLERSLFGWECAAAAATARRRRAHRVSPISKHPPASALLLSAPAVAHGGHRDLSRVSTILHPFCTTACVCAPLTHEHAVACARWLPFSAAELCDTCEMLGRTGPGSACPWHQSRGAEWLEALRKSDSFVKKTVFAMRQVLSTCSDDSKPRMILKDLVESFPNHIGFATIRAHGTNLSGLC